MNDQVGFIGLGAIGGRMARRLVAAGRPVLTWTRSGTRVAGAEAADSPAEVARRSGVVLSCLLDAAAVEDVHGGGAGVLANAAPGTIVVEHGTFPPQLARRLAADAADRGVAFVDAPVTGGPEGADAGSLVAMYGGARDRVDARASLFSDYLGRMTHVGAPGAGLALKLVNQLLVSVHMVAAVEAACLLQMSGISTDAGLSVLSQGWAASAMLDRQFPRVLSQDFESTGATIGGLVPVLQLVSDALADAGIESQLVPIVRGVFDRGMAAGAAHSDPSALAMLYSPSNAVASRRP